MDGGFPGDDVTICTVVTPLHKRLATINHRLVAALNPGCAPRWIIADVAELGFAPERIATLFLRNHPVGRQFAIDWQAAYLEVLKARHFEIDPIGALIPGACVVPGPTVAQTIARAAARHGLSQAEAEQRLSANLGSHQHAGALRTALSRVRTRYAVIMDPDLYVVRPDWICAVTGHMAARQLSVFGVPWHPRWYEKQRAFPAPHLMVVDLERTGPVDELMEPGVRAPGDRYVSAIWRTYAEASRVDAARARRGLLRRLGPAIGEDLRQRRTIGRARDTGHALAASVAAAGGRVETAVPVFRAGTEFAPGGVSPLQTGLAPEALLPEAWRYRPRRRGAVSGAGFREAGYPDADARGWEEFVWRGEPFAFHLRCEPKRSRSWRIDHEGLTCDLDLILRRIGRPALEPPQVRSPGLGSIEGRRARLLALLLDGGFAEDEIITILPLDPDRPELREALRAAAARTLRGAQASPAKVGLGGLMDMLADAGAGAPRAQAGA
jgi:hypothetical protein